MLILFITIVLISLNYRLLVENVVEDKQNIVSSYLALLLTIGVFVLIAIPIMSLYTRKKCPKCGKYLLRNVYVCHHCGYDYRISRDK